MPTLENIQLAVERELRFRGAIDAADSQAVANFDTLYDTIRHVLSRGDVTIDRHLSRFRPSSEGELDRAIGHHVTLLHAKSWYASGLSLAVCGLTARITLFMANAPNKSTQGAMCWRVAIDEQSGAPSFVDLDAPESAERVLPVCVKITEHMKAILVKAAKGAS